MLSGWAGATVVVAGSRRHHHRHIGPDWVIIVIGLVGQSWGKEKEKDKISKNEQKAYLLGLRTAADTLRQRVVVEESWGCRWPSSPPSR